MVQEGEMALNGNPDEETETELSNNLEDIPAPILRMVIEEPYEPAYESYLRPQGRYGESWVLAGLFLLFFIIALRFKNSKKYAVGLFNNLIETRTRQNVFDETVRETSLLVMLNIMWCVCVGIIGYSCLSNLFGDKITGVPSYLGMLWGMVFAAGYTMLMALCYLGVGTVFSDKAHARLWLKGFTASQAITTPLLFFTALWAMCLPQYEMSVGISALIIFILSKIVFIWKGFRIFFNQISSWVLFLCYLCSLEIVPLVLMFRLTKFLI